MHLDTVFATVDVDAVTVYPRVADAIRAYSLRPSDKEDGGLCIREEESFLDAAQDACCARTAGHGYGGRRVPGRVETMGRREQSSGHRAGCGLLEERVRQTADRERPGSRLSRSTHRSSDGAGEADTA